MSLRINTNVSAANAYRNLSVNDKSVSGSMEKLSSGLRINRAADDAAGLSVSEGLKSQIGGLTVAARNAQDGVNVAQTADGALGETSSILQRMRDLSVQAANSGSQDSDAKAAANTEFQELNKELDRIVSSTKFGSQSLLDGSYNGAFQVDSASKNTNAAAQISIDLTSGSADGALGKAGLTGLNAEGLGVKDLDLTTDASAAIDALDTAIKGVSTVRSQIGAIQNRFEHTINNVNVAIENLSASKSSITDTDMASEMVKFSKNQILQQAGTSMLAQANQSGQGVLKLLG
ncbi:flagellin [Cryptosporangium arvum]|uniref:Flagellin n=1 Tax=Cryptosporangium arvum DSM 44712 TaxID=927661 RepID=A0A010YL73_9ACTN|nr:flagellin [Cryptosporangium arvum]EXG80985.1 flagellin/flagellar hook associated protein [Cryptosporangium arvum DSM 44712]